MNEELTEQKSLDRTKKLLLKWKNDKKIQKLKEFYDTKSFSGILGVERREMSHSNFIAWILNDKESHNLGQFAIKQLFDMLLEYGEDNIKDSLDLYNDIRLVKDEKYIKIQFDNLYKALMLNSYIIEDLKIGVERVLTGGRIDIIVSMSIRSKNNDIKLPEKVNIIIENKVDSSEHSSQTTTYYNYYTTDNKYKNDLNLFVFLSPIATLKLKEALENKKSLAECEHFISINYQLLSDNIFERALNHDISDRVKFIITEYLLSLRKSSKENKGQTMATGNLEKELLKEFWEHHQELLMKIFPVIAELEEDSDKAEILNDFSDIVTKNFTRYENLNDYIDAEINSKNTNTIEMLKLLISKIEADFGDKIEITYAPSNINIKNPKALKGKVFVYIAPKKDSINLGIKQTTTKNEYIDILLSSIENIENNHLNYMEQLHKAFNGLDN